MPKLQTSKIKRTTISPAKFILLSCLTLGFYHAYWGWRAWETVRRSKKETYKFRSSLRGWFLAVSNFSLLPRLKELSAKKNYSIEWDPALIAAGYLSIRIIANIQAMPVFLLPLWVISETVLLLPYVKAHNNYIEATQAEFTPDEINKWLVIAVILGVLIVSLFLIG